jgi:anti-sigma-K factor RskA
MDLRQIQELLPFYALDALTEEEHELVEKYLAEHPEARQQVEEMSRTTSALPYGVAPVEPAPQTKEALMARVAAEAREREPVSVPARPSQRAPQQPSQHVSLFENFFRTFSLVTAAIAILWVVLLNVQVARLQGELSTLNARLEAQANSLKQIIDNMPQSNPVITVSLEGTEVQPQVQGQLLVDPNSQSAVLIITGLSPLEPGKTYQVWLIDGGAPVSAGLLTVNEQGQGVFIVTSEDAIGSFKKLGVSIEPAGGSPQPTGDIVILSDL